MIEARRPFAVGIVRGEGASDERHAGELSAARSSCDGTPFVQLVAAGALFGAGGYGNGGTAPVTCAGPLRAVLANREAATFVDNQRSIPRGATPRTLAILTSWGSDFAPNFSMSLSR